MSEEKILGMEKLEEEIRRDNDRRYAFYRMLNATDRVLWRLEELNRDGIKQVPGGMCGRMRDSLTELPLSCLGGFRGSSHGQEVLDSVFEVQERLFRWRDPQRLGGGGELRRVAQAYEAGGGDMIWVSSGRERDGPGVEPLTLLAATAVVTARARLGATARVGSPWPAALLANVVTTLAELSRGRVVVGIE